MKKRRLSSEGVKKKKGGRAAHSLERGKRRRRADAERLFERMLGVLKK